MTVNQKLRIIRKEKGITTTALAQKVGVSQSCIVRYENGTISYIPSDTLEKIAAALSCSVSDLTEDDDRYVQAKTKKRASSKTLSQEEYSLILKYRALPKDAQLIVQQLCDLHFDHN